MALRPSGLLEVMHWDGLSHRALRAPAQHHTLKRLEGSRSLPNIKAVCLQESGRWRDWVVNCCWCGAFGGTIRTTRKCVKRANCAISKATQRQHRCWLAQVTVFVRCLPSPPATPPAHVVLRFCCEPSSQGRHERELCKSLGACARS